MDTAAVWEVIWACLGLIRQHWPVQLSLLYAIGGMRVQPVRVMYGRSAHGGDGYLCKPVSRSLNRN